MSKTRSTYARARSTPESAQPFDPRCNISWIMSNQCRTNGFFLFVVVTAESVQVQGQLGP